METAGEQQHGYDRTQRPAANGAHEWKRLHVSLGSFQPLSDAARFATMLRKLHSPQMRAQYTCIQHTRMLSAFMVTNLLYFILF